MSAASPKQGFTTMSAIVANDSRMSSSASTRLILEGIVTTVPSLSLLHDGLTPEALASVNVAPMGPYVDEAVTHLTLRPFTSSTTYQNIKATGHGVFHVTDDALMIARGAIGTLRAGLDAAVRRADVVAGIVLTGTCRYYEFEVVEVDDREERTRIEARVVHMGRLRDFFGFNRARHAVLEAAILATRLHLTGAAPVLAEFDRLNVAVQKTGGPAEHQAMAELRAFVRAADGREPTRQVR